MNRRDFIRSLFAAGVAVVAAPLMPAKPMPGTLHTAEMRVFPTRMGFGFEWTGDFLLVSPAQKAAYERMGYNMMSRLKPTRTPAPDWYDAKSEHYEKF